MKWKLLLVTLLASLVLPTTAGAVDFNISDMENKRAVGTGWHGGPGAF